MYLSTLKMNSIGHLIFNPIRFFHSYDEDRKIIILIDKKKLVNKAVYETIKKHYTSKKIIFVESSILVFFLRRLIKISKYINFLNYFINNIETYHNRHIKKKDWKEFYSSAKIKFGGPGFAEHDSLDLKNKPLFKVSDYFEEYFQKWRIENDLYNFEFVLFFSRDGGYYSEKNENPRNSNFINLDKSIEFLINKKIKVIRIGRNPKSKYQNNSKYFFDYSSLFENRYDDIAELMMFKECKFIVSQNSGLNFYQWFFDKKILLYDWFPIGIRPPFNNCIYIPKKYKKDNSYIKYSDIPNHLLIAEEEAIFKENNIQIEESSSEEILEFIKNNFEKLDRLKDIDYNKITVANSGETSSYLCKNWYKSNRNLFI